MINKLKNQKGFTLVETLIAVSIFALVGGLIALFARNLWIYSSTGTSELSIVNLGRSALRTMTAEIRTASSGSDGAYAVSAVSPTSFTFYSDIYDNGLKEKIRYFLNGTNLQKGVIVPTGSPLGYTGAETITTLVANVTNASIFDYYDSNYDGTTAPLASPIDVSDVRLVKISLTIDDNPNRPPPAVSVSTQVSLRNIKDNL